MQTKRLTSHWRTHDKLRLFTATAHTNAKLPRTQSIDTMLLRNYTQVECGKTICFSSEKLIKKTSHPHSILFSLAAAFSPIHLPYWNFSLVHMILTHRLTVRTHICACVIFDRCSLPNASWGVLKQRRNDCVIAHESFIQWKRTYDLSFQVLRRVFTAARASTSSAPVIIGTLLQKDKIQLSFNFSKFFLLCLSCR